MLINQSKSYINIEVVYAATPKQQTLLTAKVLNDCTIREAIQFSGIMEIYPEIDLEVNKTGIFSKQNKNIDEKNILKEQDRIEIYRPLAADPKLMRKNKAIKQKNT